MDEIAARRKLEADVWAAYKSEIFDWCGHALAIELVADKFGLTRKFIERLVAKSDPATFL